MGFGDILSEVSNLLQENNDESFRKALDSLQQVEESNSMEAEYWDWVSRCYLCLDNREKAEEAFKKFIALSFGRISFTPSNELLMTEYPRMIERLGGKRDAESILKRLHSQHPESLKVVTALSNFYNRNYSTEHSMQVLQKSSLLKQEVSLQVLLADVLVKLEKEKEAVKILKDAKKKNKDNPSIDLAVGKIYLSNKEFKNAEKEFKRAVELNPTDVEALHHYGLALYFLRNLEKAKAVFKQGLKITDTRMDLWNSLAAVHVELDEFKEAEETFKHIIEKWPKFHQTYSNLGVLYNRSGMSHKSKEWVLRSAEVALQKCDELLYERKYPECIKMCQEVLRYDPRSALAYTYSGLVMLNMMEFKQAQTLLEKAEQLDPQNSEVLAAKSYFELAQGRFKRAERFALQALELNSESVRALVNLTIINNENGEFVKGEKYGRLALEHPGDHGATTLLLVRSLVEQNKVSEAMSQITHVIYDDPWNAALWLSFSILLDRLGETEKSEAARFRALELKPDIEEKLSTFKLERSK